MRVSSGGAQAKVDAKGIDRLEALEAYPTYWLGNLEVPFCKTGSDFRIGDHAQP